MTDTKPSQQEIWDAIHYYLGSDSMSDCWGEVKPLLDRFAAYHSAELIRELRLNDTHYHNTFEPDNCNCMFCTALERSAKEAEHG